MIETAGISVATVRSHQKGAAESLDVPRIAYDLVARVTVFAVVVFTVAQVTTHAVVLELHMFARIQGRNELFARSGMTEHTTGVQLAFAREEPETPLVLLADAGVRMEELTFVVGEPAVGIKRTLPALRLFLDSHLDDGMTELTFVLVPTPALLREMTAVYVPAVCLLRFLRLLRLLLLTLKKSFRVNQGAFFAHRARRRTGQHKEQKLAMTLHRRHVGV